MKIVKSTITNNPDYKKAIKITVKKLMLHSVGCPQPTATVFVNNFNKSNSNVSVHAFIDANDGTVHQVLPWDYRAGHCGGACNNDSIAVEMCEPPCIKYVGGSTFVATDEAKAKVYVNIAYNSAVELFAYLCKEYNLNPITDIISHCEAGKKGLASKHSDPEHLWNQLNTGYTMDGFRRDVAKAMGKTVVESNPSKPNANVKTDSRKVQFIKAIQSATGAVVDGIAGNETISKTPTLSRLINHKHKAVKPVQEYLIYLGYSCGNCGADGDYGKDTAAAVKKYQAEHGCTSDGIITKKQKTWKSLLGMI